MAGNLVSGSRKTAKPKREYLYKYRVNGKLKSSHFNSVSDKAALRYCGFKPNGERMTGGGLLANKLPKGAKIVHVSATGKRAKK